MDGEQEKHIESVVDTVKKGNAELKHGIEIVEEERLKEEERRKEVDEHYREKIEVLEEMALECAKGVNRLKALMIEYGGGGDELRLSMTFCDFDDCRYSVLSPYYEEYTCGRTFNRLNDRKCAEYRED